MLHENGPASCLKITTAKIMVLAVQFSPLATSLFFLHSGRVSGNRDRSRSPALNL